LHHLTGWKLLQRDCARRLRYQEKQRIQQKCNGFVDTKKAYGRFELSEGQLKSFSAKLIK